MKLPRIPLRRQKLPKVVGENVGSGTQEFLENGARGYKTPCRSGGKGRADAAMGEVVGEGRK